MARIERTLVYARGPWLTPRPANEAARAKTEGGRRANEAWRFCLALWRRGPTQFPAAGRGRWRVLEGRNGTVLVLGSLMWLLVLLPVNGCWPGREHDRAGAEKSTRTGRVVRGRWKTTTWSRARRRPVPRNRQTAKLWDAWCNTASLVDAEGWEERKKPSSSTK